LLIKGKKKGKKEEEEEKIQKLGGKESMYQK
jgi:hypothetical protein